MIQLNGFNIGQHIYQVLQFPLISLSGTYPVGAGWRWGVAKHQKKKNFTKKKPYLTSHETDVLKILKGLLQDTSAYASKSNKNMEDLIM